MKNKRKQNLLIESASGYKHLAQSLENIESIFSKGSLLAKTTRNTLKRTNIDGIDVVIKSFKIPRAINAYLYANVANTKAKKSYLHANALLSLGINTPEPIAYIEQRARGRIYHSYYICQFLPHDATMADIFDQLNTDDTAKNTLREFTRFTYTLHQSNVLHVDHNAGNTLINYTNDASKFSLVDVNRMQFKTLSLTQRLNNFVKLTDDKTALTIIAHTYAECMQLPKTECQHILFKLKNKHLRKLALKKQFKQRVKRSNT